MKFLTQRYAALTGAGLIAAGVGLILVPEASASHPSAAALTTPISGATTASVSLPSLSPATSASPAAPPSPTPSPAKAPTPTPTGPATSANTPARATTGHATSPSSGGMSIRSPIPPAGPTSAPTHSSPTSTPPPATIPSPPASSTPAPTHPAGLITNVGTQRSVGVVNGSTSDGSTMVAWHTDAGITDQHWTLGFAQSDGKTGFIFKSNIATGSVMDLNVSTGHVSLWHSLTGTNQLWWVAKSPVSSAYYVHNTMTSDCLTDNGLGNDLTVAPCVTGNLAQVWYMP